MIVGLRYFSLGLVGVFAALITTGCSIHPPTNCVDQFGVIRMFPSSGATVDSGPVAFWVEMDGEHDWESYGSLEGDLVISSEAEGQTRLVVIGEVTGEEYTISVDLDPGPYVWWFEGRFERVHSYTTDCLFPPHLLVVQDGAGEQQ